MRQPNVIEQTKVSGPLGEFEVSTVRTMAGGAEPIVHPRLGLSMADYEDCQLWPYETMVFRAGTRFGLYHAPSKSEAAAREHHGLMVETIQKGLEFGGGVDEYGNPSTTREQWEAVSAKDGEAIAVPTKRQGAS